MNTGLIASGCNRKYESLLYRIANSLGFDDKQAIQMIEETYLKSAQFNAVVDRNEDRIGLTKILVRQCVFKIGSMMFSKTGTMESFDGYINSLDCIIPSKTGKVPLSLQTVYILFHVIGFNEKEIAHILNANTIQIRERLARVTQIINDPQV
jgi:hypothetical protein